MADGHNNAMHIFDNTVMPPKQTQTIMVRDQPGWITFSIDGRHAYPSTGEVFDHADEEAALHHPQRRDRVGRSGARSCSRSCSTERSR